MILFDFDLFGHQWSSPANGGQVPDSKGTPLVGEGGVSVTGGGTKSIAKDRTICGWSWSEKHYSGR